jgi:hypothetical protein
VELLTKVVKHVAQNYDVGPLLYDITFNFTIAFLDVAVKYPFIVNKLVF